MTQTHRSRPSRSERRRSLWLCHAERPSPIRQRARASGREQPGSFVMKIFVAGATGAVGLPLVRALCTLGHQDGLVRAQIVFAN
jgi:hypothetical protein